MSSQLRRCLLVLLACSWTAEIAVAQVDAAEALIQHGVELRKQQQDAQALALFRQAYELQPSPRARAQIALAEQALGNWLDAERGLVAVLADTEDPWIEHYRAPLEAALETVRDHLGSLRISTNVDHAAIRLNGELVGSSPLKGPLRVVAGPANIEVAAAGYPPVQRAVTVPARGSVEAAIVVVAAAAAQKPAPAFTPAAVSPPAPAVRQATNRTWPARRVAGYVTLAAAAPLLATGVVAHVVRENNARVYADDARCFFGDQTRDQRCGGYGDRAETAEIIALVGYASAGVALGAAAWLLLSARDADEAEPRARVLPALGPASASVACVLAF